MGNIHFVGSCFVCIWLCLPFTVYCQVNVSPVHISLQQQVEGGNVTLICAATNFNPEVHTFTWRRRFPNSSLVDVTADDRVYISNVTLISDVVYLYNQSLTINNLNKSDEGKYLCEVTDSAGIVGNGEGSFIVNTTEEFPVCFPEGSAVVNEGDTLSCRTVIDERTPTVSDTNTPLARTDWTNSSLAGKELGSQLQKNITIQDDGVTFFCISIIPQNNNWTSLSCKIGPLTVTPLTSTHVTLPITTIVGISVGAFLLLLLLILLLVHIICCQCKPKRWLGAKSYLLNFGGFFGSTIRRTKPGDPRQADMALGRQNPDGSDGPPPNEPTASGDQVRFSFDGGEDIDVLPVPTSEPNIYEGHGIPGTSTQPDIQSDPDDDAYWNEDLKQHLADAVGNEDEDD